MDKNQPDWNPAHSSVGSYVNKQMGGDKFDPTKSSVATGNGTPWGEGDNAYKWNPSYSQLGQKGGPLSSGYDPFSMARDAQTNLDNQNRTAQDSYDKKKASDANAAASLAQTQAATENENKRQSDAQTGLQNSNSFEQAWLTAARRKNQPGGRAYGAFSGGL